MYISWYIKWGLDYEEAEVEPLFEAPAIKCTKWGLPPADPLFNVPTPCPPIWGAQRYICTGVPHPCKEGPIPRSPGPSGPSAPTGPRATRGSAMARSSSKDRPAPVQHRSPTTAQMRVMSAPQEVQTEGVKRDVLKFPGCQAPLAPMLTQWIQEEKKSFQFIFYKEYFPNLLVI